MPGKQWLHFMSGIANPHDDECMKTAQAHGDDAIQKRMCSNDNMLYNHASGSLEQRCIGGIVPLASYEQCNQKTM